MNKCVKCELIYQTETSDSEIPKLYCSFDCECDDYVPGLLRGVLENETNG